MAELGLQPRTVWSKEKDFPSKPLFPQYVSPHQDQMYCSIGGTSHLREDCCLKPATDDGTNDECFWSVGKPTEEKHKLFVLQAPTNAYYVHQVHNLHQWQERVLIIPPLLLTTQIKGVLNFAGLRKFSKGKEN